MINLCSVEQDIGTFLSFQVAAFDQYRLTAECHQRLNTLCLIPS
jgi:hypothetical protein